MLTECHAFNANYPRFWKRLGRPIPIWWYLIERAFIEAQIDGQKAELAFLWLSTKTG